MLHTLFSSARVERRCSTRFVNAGLGLTRGAVVLHTRGSCACVERGCSTRGLRGLGWVLCGALLLHTMCDGRRMRKCGERPLHTRHIWGFWRKCGALLLHTRRECWLGSRVWSAAAPLGVFKLLCGAALLHTSGVCSMGLLMWSRGAPYGSRMQGLESACGALLLRTGVYPWCSQCGASAPHQRSVRARGAVLLHTVVEQHRIAHVCSPMLRHQGERDVRAAFRQFAAHLERERGACLLLGECRGGRFQDDP